MAPPIISIVSKKGSGKTTLLEKLIPELTGRGYRVGTVKHDMHGFDMDHEGKDTWRHKQAGASTIAISSPWKLSLIKDVDQEATLDDIVATYFADMDIILTEGYYRAQKPQIEVYRSTVHKKPLHEKGKANSLIAVVSDVQIDLGVPNFNIDDIASIADIIEQQYISSKDRR